MGSYRKRCLETMSNVLLVQNTRIEGSGYLGELLKKMDLKLLR